MNSQTLDPQDLVAPLPSFSIVIPTYNEEGDIQATLVAALNQGALLREILVVDDSDDRTPQLVCAFDDPRVRLIRRETATDGCCGARNLGMTQCQGEIIILLNADVTLPPGFLARLVAHYADGADFVLVESVVENADTLFPRFLQCEHEYLYGEAANLLWTEGFSCRRSAALAVGLIPSGFSEPFCRDWLFGHKLVSAGFQRRIDRSLVVRHRAPEGLQPTFRTRRTRGRIAALFRYHVNLESPVRLVSRSTAKSARCVGRLLLLCPVVWRAWKLMRLSPKGARDWFPFMAAEAVSTVAFSAGELFTALRIARGGQGPMSTGKQLLPNKGVDTSEA